MSQENDLPDGWDLARVRDKYGFTNKPSDRKLDTYNEIAFVPMDLVPTDRLTFSNFILKKPRDIASGTYFEEGDLLVSKITPCFENGKQGIIKDIPNGFGIATTEVIPIKPVAGESEVEFLAYALLNHETRHALASKMEGATGRQRLSKTVLQEWEINYPPQKERSAIVSLLSKIQFAIEVQDKTISTLKELKAATMAKLFREGLRGEKLKETEIGEIPESWEALPISELVTRSQYGLSVRGEKSGQYPILRMNCQKDGFVVFDDLQFVSLEAETFAGYSLARGDVLFNRTNSYELVGRTALYNSDREAVFASYLVRLRLNDRVRPGFFNYYMNQASTQAALKGLATRAVGQSNISASKLKTFKVPVPRDNKEQEDIENMLDRISVAIEGADKRRETLQQIFSSMLNQLMTGQVRVTPLLEER